MYCKVCGPYDEYYDEHSLLHHNETPKHICNLILANFQSNKRYFSKNREGIIVLCDATSLPMQDAQIHKHDKVDHLKVRIYAKPMQKVQFSFSMANDMKKEDILIIGVQLAHPQPQFEINNHQYIFGEEPRVLEKKSSVSDIHVNFSAQDIGQYEMPIMFTFYRRSDEKNIIIAREMVVLVQDEVNIFPFLKNPFTSEEWEPAKRFIISTAHRPLESSFKISKLLKILLPRGLEEHALEGLQEPPEVKEQLRILMISVRAIFDEGPSINNYMMYFHHLLWWEEIINRIGLKKYNMTDVTLELKDGHYLLEVPGLAEKRPSLLRGDRVYIRPVENVNIIFEGIIKDINDAVIHIAEMDESFKKYYSEVAHFNVRFMTSRVPMERMHMAVSRLFDSKHECRVFPTPLARIPPVKHVKKFYNPLIENNKEQRSAVEHILSRTSGKCPYIVFGPPGTGKTMTIVEAIIQLVVQNTKNRIMVCTDSNMAADHIAVTLLKYNKVLNISYFLLRANSQSREWTAMPPELGPVSNGTSYETFASVTNATASMYRIFITTLSHSAKYSSVWNQKRHKLSMTHLFIDEAAQASEPACLVPVTGLLAPAGQLVLAGDPRQLGPVCLSHAASERGLGMSLLERLKITYGNLYNDDPNYITMLVKNFRSDPDVLAIPNELFYDNCLEALAPEDPISKVSILGLPGGDSSITFHAVNSKELRMGNTPSFSNEKELDMIKRYVKKLVEIHKVSLKDIGIIAPYIRQVYRIKGWLKSEDYEAIEVGTVESFQGKEKRIILVTTVRANCQLLDFDAKYGLGFLVDDKRFNVTLTRAKAKLIIIGNPSCLTRDLKWRKYMELCKEKNCYFGQENVQLERTANLLHEVARIRFDRCRLTDALKSQKVK